jgi:hypothetical protein
MPALAQHQFITSRDFYRYGGFSGGQSGLLVIRDEPTGYCQI